MKCEDTTCTGIGKRLKELRIKAKLSQAELAEQLRVSREAVNMWERGLRDMKSGTIVQLAEFFHVSCDFILTGVQATHQDTHKITGLSEEAISMLQLLNLWAADKGLGEKSHIAELSLSSIDEIIKDPFGHLIVYRIMLYHDIDFSTLFLESPQNPDVDGIPLDSSSLYFNTVQTLLSFGKGRTSIPLDTFDEAYLLDIVSLIKEWRNRKREEASNHAPHP